MTIWGNLLLLSLPFLWMGFGMGVVRSAWVAMLGYHSVMALCMWWISSSLPAMRPTKLLAMPRSIGWRLIPWGALLLFLPLYYLWPIVATNDLRRLLQFQGIRSFWLFALYYPLINPVLEELYWRRFMDARLKRKWLGDLFFGGYHALVLIHFTTWWFALLCAAVLVGVARTWRMATRDTGSLYVAYTAHLAANVAIIGCLFLLGAV